MNPRRQEHFKKRIAAYILLLGILGIAIFFLNIFFTAKKPLFISPIGKSIIDTVTVQKILKENNISFSQVTLEDNVYLVNIQNNGQVRLDPNKDMNKQIASLQRILLQLTIEGKPFKSMDFRFLEPIISF